MNPTPRVTTSTTYAALLADAVNLIQQKRDYNESGALAAVAETLTNTRSTAAWANWVDDIVLALWQRVDGVTAASSVIFDTRGAGFTTGTINASASGDFTLTLPKQRNVMNWLRVVSNASSVGGTLAFYVDSGRTKPCYTAAIASGSPAVAAAAMTDGTPWSVLAEDGTALSGSGASWTLYGRITNGGAVNSTYTVQIFGAGY